MGDAHEIEELRRSVHVLLESVERLVQLIETERTPAAHGAGASTPEQPVPKPPPVDWFTVSGRDRLAAWQGLAEFVEAVVHRYGVQREIRPCWWLHPTAVEELTALWHTRQFLYGPDASLGNAMQWQSAFAQSVDRLRGMFVSCRGHHVDSPPPAWMSDELRRDFQRAVSDDVSGTRPARAPREP